MRVRRLLPLLLAAAGASAPAQAAGQVELLGTIGLGRPVGLQRAGDLDDQVADD